MGEMADLFADAGYWDDEDYFGHDPDESQPFQIKCKWCRKEITLTPTDRGWRPMLHGKLHICESRLEKERVSMLNLLPDLTTPKCQFCGTHMLYRRYDPDYDEGWLHSYRITCPECHSLGPVIEHGTELWSELNDKKV